MLKSYLEVELGIPMDQSTLQFNDDTMLDPLTLNDFADIRDTSNASIRIHVVLSGNAEAKH